MLKVANMLSLLVAVSLLWIVGGMSEVILVVIVTTSTMSSTLLVRV